MDSRLLLLVCLVLVVPGEAQLCGDCDGDGVAVTVLDALVAAQIAAMMSSPTPAQVTSCDVDSTLTITVLDALQMAQAALGMPGVVLACPGQPPSCAILTPSPGPVTSPLSIDVTVDDPDGGPLTLTWEWSIDGGVTWTILVPDPTSPTMNPHGVATVPSMVTFVAGLAVPSTCAWSGNFDLRVLVDDGAHTTVCTQGGYSVSLSPSPNFAGMPLDPTSVVFVLDRSCSMGWGSSPVTVPGMPTATPWQAVQYHLNAAVDCLDPATLFGVVLFNHDSLSWQPGLVPATPMNKAAAQGWVSSQWATGGATFSTAVGRGLQLTGGPPTQILFTSDGLTNIGYQDVIDTTTVNGGQARIDTVSWNATGFAQMIMQDIATQNGGTSIP